MASAVDQVEGGSGVGNSYSTVVICHADEKASRAFFGEMLDRFPMGGGQVPHITMLGLGDAASVGDAARMALEARLLDAHEKIELALDLLECLAWDDCLAKFAEWDFVISDGELVDAPAAQVSS